MNRLIKFRAKEVLSDRWVYGNYAILDGYHVIYEDERPLIIKYTTLGQFTGLKDKNGCEIYEEDIISTDLSRPYNIVVFRNGAFMYQCHDSGQTYYDIMLPMSNVDCNKDDYLEIIGNINENPELLGD